MGHLQHSLCCISIAHCIDMADDKGKGGKPQHKGKGGGKPKGKGDGKKEYKGKGGDKRPQKGKGNGEGEREVPSWQKGKAKKHQHDQYHRQSKGEEK
ncbi:hypothetical protein KIPB_014394, partial [Kipferlia bialata]|eukprot:g14394.t1